MKDLDLTTTKELEALGAVVLELRDLVAETTHLKNLTDRRECLVRANRIRDAVFEADDEERYSVFAGDAAVLHTSTEPVAIQRYQALRVLDVKAFVWDNLLQKYVIGGR